MRHIYLLGLMACFAISSQAQVVFSSDVSSWANGIPTDFVGAKTSMHVDSITETMTGVVYGSSAANLRNASNSHRRFTTQSVNVMDGETYDISFWVRGQGEIRTGLYDGRSTGSGYSGYNSYETINSSSWMQITQSVTCAHDTADGEFILSVRNTAIGVGLDIDSVVVGTGVVNPPVLVSIYDIQYTTNPNGDSPLLGQQVITGGIVTMVDSSGYYIEENEAAWSGIYVFDSSLPSRGDSVIVEGAVAEYFNATQIGSVTNVTNAGAFGTPNPVNLSTADCNLEDWEGVLVQVTATCIDDDVAANFGQWQVDDGSGFIWIDDLYYDYTPSMGTDYRVTGPLTYSFSERKIEPRDMNDVEVISSVGELLFADLNVYPNPATEGLMVDLGENQESVSYLISDLSGRIVSEGLASGRYFSFDVSSLANGQYSLMLGKANAVQNVSFAVQH